jgi:4-hydroxy-2-oxoheptanedioate aldolase
MDGGLASKLASGATVTGMINFISHPMVVEIMARAGLDFTMIDMEHCPLDLHDLAHLVRACDAAGIAPLVRVPEVEPPLIKRVLNLGVQGIVIPHASVDRCRRLLDAALYAPEGSRGACPVVRATGYCAENWSEHVRRTNRELFIMPLVEDVDAIDDFAALAALPGISAYFVGPYDLSVSIGVPGASFEHPQMREALERVLAEGREHGKYVFTTVGDRQDAAYSQGLIDAGVRGVLFATDALVLLQACRRMVSAVPPAQSFE